MQEAPIPSAVAMLVCDQIISEQGTNKKSLIGIFDKFISPQFPAVLPRLAVYVKLADAMGDYEFRVRLVKLKDESLMHEIKIAVKVPDASPYFEFALNIQGAIQFAEEGVYEFQLYSGENYLHRITMLAMKSEIPQTGGKIWPQQS